MPRSFLAGWVLCALSAGPVPALAQGHVHAHGSASLDVAVDARSVTLRLDAPLQDLLGFERAPRSVAERGRVTALVEQLKRADKLFVPDTQGGCRLADVRIGSAVLGLGPEPAPAKGAPVPEHADLDMIAVFACEHTAATRFVDIKLFDAFQRLQTVQAQVATATGQFRVSVRRGASRLTLSEVDSRAQRMPDTALAAAARARDLQLGRS